MKRTVAGTLLALALFTAPVTGSASAIDDGKAGGGSSCGPVHIPIIDAQGNRICVPICPSGTRPILVWFGVMCAPIYSPSLPNPGPIA